MATKEKKNVEVKEGERKEVCALWLKDSKRGTGKYLEGKNLVGFINGKKKNPKEPDLRIYTKDSEGNLSKEPFLSLWCQVGKSGVKYFSGKLKDKWVVGFINDIKVNDKRPYISIYFQDEKPAKVESKPEEIKTEVKNDDLPF